jgi:membrane-bound lytic murein transglycosylase D
MRDSSHGRQSTPAGASRRPPKVHVVGAGQTLSFDRSFVFGREEGCDVLLENSARVSRRHAEVRLEDGRWWVIDLKSANGTFLNGRRIDREALPAEANLMVGEGGPLLQLRLDPPPGRMDNPPAGSGDGAASVAPPAERTIPRRGRPPATAEREPRPAGQAPAGPGAPEAEDLSLSKVMRKYFDEDSDHPAGERTQFIRQAYQQVQTKQRRQFGLLIVAALSLGVVALGIAGWQAYRSSQLRAAAEEVFFQLREQDLMLAMQIAADTEISPERLAELTARRQRAAEAYEGFVEELGVYRRLSEEERMIYNVARKFNESEFSIPGGFVREVQTYIRMWQRSNRFQTAVAHAEEMGYTPIIVRTMRRYGLPPEFFYLVMQESNFNTRAVGPQTRWGIAKGAWQFIPTTGQAYGLRVGPRAETREFDPQDQRHDFAIAADAAGRYLLDIYTQLAQASGLLVCASYNWGEHRVASGLDRLPPPGMERARAAMAGIPMNPQERSYWRFYSAHADRMPDETKGYVMNIFAAAVIGQNPRFFGIDMDNPLARYLEAPLEELDRFEAPAGDDFSGEDQIPAGPLPPVPDYEPPPASEQPRRLGLDALRERP